MAFIKIQKMGKTLEVSKTSFENFFKNAGWNEAGEIPASSNSPEALEGSKKSKSINNKANEEKFNQEDSGESGDTSNDEWDEAIEEMDEMNADVQKPISEMNRDELIQFAKDHDISLAGLSKNNQIREAIKTALKDKEA